MNFEKFNVLISPLRGKSTDARDTRAAPCGERRTTQDAWERSRDVTHRYNQRRRISVRVWKLHVNAGLYRPTYAPNGWCHRRTRSPQVGSRFSDNRCASVVVPQVFGDAPHAP